MDGLKGISDVESSKYSGFDLVIEMSDFEDHIDIDIGGDGSPDAVGFDIDTDPDCAIPWPIIGTDHVQFDSSSKSYGGEILLRDMIQNGDVSHDFVRVFLKYTV